MTSDNGKEFARHETIAKALKAKFYFAHVRGGDKLVH
jgi:IS30 family transposase